MTLELPRRKFLIGLASLIAAPAVVRLESLMPVRSFKTITLQDYVDRIMMAHAKELQLQIENAIIYGSPYMLNYSDGLFGVKEIALNDLHSRH